MLARTLAIALTLTSVAAFAQSPPKTAAPAMPKAEQQQSAACAHADTQATVGQGGDAKVQTPEGKPLGEKLAQSNGVICPPAGRGRSGDPRAHAAHGEDAGHSAAGHARQLRSIGAAEVARFRRFA